MALGRAEIGSAGSGGEFVVAIARDDGFAARIHRNGSAIGVIDQGGIDDRARWAEFNDEPDLGVLRRLVKFGLPGIWSRGKVRRRRLSRDIGIAGAIHRDGVCRIEARPAKFRQVAKRRIGGEAGNESIGGRVRGA